MASKLNHDRFTSPVGPTAAGARVRLPALAAALAVFCAALAVQSPAQARDRHAAGTAFGTGAGGYAGQVHGGAYGGQRWGGQGYGGPVYVVPQPPSVLLGQPVWNRGYDGQVIVPGHAYERRWNNRGHNGSRAYRQGYRDGQRDARRELRRGW